MMKTFQAINRCAGCVIFMAFLIVGCGQEAEPPPAPKAVRQKIAAAPKDQKETPKTAPVKTQPVKQETVDVATKTSKPEAGKIASPAVPATAPAESGKVASADSKAPPAEEKAAEIKLAALSKEEPPEETEEEKVDPFAPLFKDEPERKKPQIETKTETKKRIPLTPLERIDLGQLKLVAIVNAASGNKALVEEANGKGYIVTRGTYIGINSGRIIEILKDRVVVEEEIEDLLGKVTISRRELTLQKPPGDF